MPIFSPTEIIQPIVKDFQSSIDNMLHGNFSLSQIDGFPFQIYSGNIERYRELMDWFTGKALRPPVGAEAEDYPVRINPINGTCLKHGYALFGEVVDDARPLVVTKLVPDDSEDGERKKSDRKKAADAESRLYRLWWENFGRVMMMRNGITAQVFGGCVFHLRHVPWQAYRTIPLQIERISPEQFVGFPETGDEFRLRESWIVKPITYKDAERYGIKIDQSERSVYWIEHWTPEKYEIRINREIIKGWKAPNGEMVKGEGPNLWGFVPTVYIPHIRVGDFYGESQISQLIGLVKEINLRWGDTGDAHNADTHSYIAIRNTNGSPEVLRLAPGLEALDLGSSDALAGDKHEPDAFEIKKGTVTEAHIKYMEMLMDQYRRDASIPKVADGEDEGSQRSASTLVARMWPLISHINTERMFWGGGMDWLSSMILRIMQIEGLEGITEEHIRMRTRQVWAPVLPKDREVFINELVSRAANDLGSPQHLIEMTGDVEDVDEEIENILQWQKDKAKIAAEASPFNQMNGGGGFGNKPGQPDNNNNPNSAKPADKKVGAGQQTGTKE